MDLQTLLDKRNVTKEHLSEVSGVSEAVISDICAGRKRIERCPTETVRQLAKAMDCAMEDIVEPFSPYDSATDRNGMSVIDFTEQQKRKKTYAGRNGSKISVIYEGEQYMLKFPSRARQN